MAALRIIAAIGNSITEKIILLLDLGSGTFVLLVVQQLKSLQKKRFCIAIENTQSFIDFISRESLTVCFGRGD